MKKIGLCHSCNLIQGVDSKYMLCDKCIEEDNKMSSEPVKLKEEV